MKKIAMLALSTSLMACSGSKPILGVDKGSLEPCPDSPNCVSSQAKDESQRIDAISFDGSYQTAHSKLLNELGNMERVQIITEEDRYIRAEFTSRLFRFVDDVEFYFVDSSNKSTLIHVRSASRLGYSDLGVNRDRIEAIRNALSDNASD